MLKQAVLGKFKSKYAKLIAHFRLVFTMQMYTTYKQHMNYSVHIVHI